MAIYIVIRKSDEGADFADYRFGLTEDACGRFRIAKKTGELTLLEPAPNDERNMLYFRAAAKVKQHWEEGGLPDQLCWAS